PQRVPTSPLPNTREEPVCSASTSRGRNSARLGVTNLTRAASAACSRLSNATGSATSSAGGEVEALPVCPLPLVSLPLGNRSTGQPSWEAYCPRVLSGSTADGWPRSERKGISLAVAP